GVGSQIRPDVEMGRTFSSGRPLAAVERKITIGYGAGFVSAHDAVTDEGPSVDIVQPQRFYGLCPDLGMPHRGQDGNAVLSTAQNEATVVTADEPYATYAVSPQVPTTITVLRDGSAELVYDPEMVRASVGSRAIMLTLAIG